MHLSFTFRSTETNDALKDYGTFLDSDRYGVVFCPHPDIVGPDFQPYLRGRWVMTEYGWTFTSDIRISEAHHGPEGARQYNYVPTFILRGLTKLHVEFDPADGVA